MPNPTVFIPSRDKLAAVSVSGIAAYEAAWNATHCGQPLGTAIDELMTTLRIPYDLASSLVWAEMSSPSVRLPA